MSKKVILLLFTILLLGLLAPAAPIPVEKKALKQLKMKRGDPQPFMKRDDAPKPSYVPTKREPSRAHKRDDPSPPTPSKWFRKA